MYVPISALVLSGPSLSDTFLLLLPEEEERRRKRRRRRRMGREFIPAE